MAIIALTTDFSGSDYFVGAMKGVILSIAADVTITDVTHEVPPQDVAYAAFVLSQVWAYFPRGTIHVVVVDPGVGSNRRILLGEYDGRWIVAPDNGLITWIHHDAAARSLRVVDNQRYYLVNPSISFQGRDVMAPVAAHLAAGVSPEVFGPSTDDVCLLEVPRRAKCEGGVFHGEVIHVDRFGNLVTNIHRDQLAERAREPGGLEVFVKDQRIGSLKKTFCDVAVGETVVIIGGAGFVEVCVRDRSAAERFAPLFNVVVTARSCDGQRPVEK